MHLGPGRLRAIIDQTPVFPDYGPAICRGFYDAYAARSPALIFLRAWRRLVEVPPPGPGSPLLPPAASSGPGPARTRPPAPGRPDEAAARNSPGLPGRPPRTTQGQPASPGAACPRDCLPAHRPLPGASTREMRAFQPACAFRHCRDGRRENGPAQSLRGISRGRL